MSDFRDYENGVADILSFLVGGEATVERNVHVPSRRGRGTRQVDVLVRGRVFGLDDTTLAVDCKRWKRKVTIEDIDRFVGFLDDLGADLGLLVASSGYSTAAEERLRDERGTRVEVVTVDELASWSPKGTIHASFRVPTADAERASAALRNAGMRVRPDPGLTQSDAEVVLQAYGHFGTGDADEQRELIERATQALDAGGIATEMAASGVSVDGGTPAHRWLQVTDRAGDHVGIKILADSEAAVDRALDRFANDLGVPREDLDVERPEGWPVTGLFGLKR